MMRTALVAALGCSVIFAGANSQAAQPVVALLKVVPDSALGVLVVNRLQDTSGRLEKLGRDLQVGIPSPLGFAKAVAGVKHGVDEQGSLAIALFSEDKDERPVGALFIPVSDYAEFLEGLRAKDPEVEIARVTFFARPVLVTHIAGFAVLVDSDQEKLLNEIKASSTGIEKLVEPFGPWLAEQTIAGLSLEPGSRRIFDALARLVGQAEQAGAASDQDKPAAESKSPMLEALKHLEGETRRCGFGIELADRGVTISMKVGFKPAGPVAQEIEMTRWPSSQGLDALPAGDYVIAGGGTLPRPWMIALARAKLTVLRDLLPQAPALSEEEQKQLDPVLSELVHPIQSLALLLRPPATGRGLLHQLTPVVIVDDARSFLAVYEKRLPAVEKWLPESRSKPLVSRIKKIELEGMPALEMDVDLSALAAEAKDSTSPAAMLMETLFGSERRFMVYFLAVDEHRITISYGSRAGALETAKALRSGKVLAAEPNVRKAVGLLPKQSNWVGLADLRGVVQLVNALLPAIAPDARKLPEFPSTLPAIARTQLTPLALDARVVLPTELIVKLGGYVAKVRELQKED
jgi:hypothetical protein